MSAIVLCPPKNVELFDEAGTSIIKSILPDTTPAPGPYEFTVQPALSYVPSLAYFCIRKLIEYPEVAQGLDGPRMRYEPSSTHQNFDIIRALIPSVFYAHQDAERLCPCMVDPRLWALLTQVYTNLPKSFRRYILPLGDKHLSLLQQIPSNPNFAMITILELPKCSLLTDDTILEFKILHSLCALDASATPLTAHGIQRLGWSLSTGVVEPGGRIVNKGPWGLRILRLQNCKNVDDSIFNSVVNFPLLCVIDIRGTRSKGNGNRGFFLPCPHRSLFHPVTITQALDNLVHISPNPISLFSHHEPFVLHVNSLSYSCRGPRKISKKPRTMPDTFTFHPIRPEPTTPPGQSSCAPPKVTTGKLETSTQARSSRGPDLEFCLRYELEHSGEADHPANYRETLSQIANLLQQNNSLALDDLDSRVDAIAEEEGRAESSLQALRQFYGRASAMISEHQCQCTKLSPPHQIQSDPRHSSRDELFMLFREPPSWGNILEPIKAPVQSSRPIPRNAGFVTRFNKSTNAPQGAGGISDMIAARKTMVDVDKPRSTLRVTERTQLRNPFLKRSSAPSSTLAEIPRRNGFSSGNGSTDAPTMSKSLKPISSLVVPPPPTQPALKKQKTKESSTHVTATRMNQESKQTTLPGMFFKRTQ